MNEETTTVVETTTEQTAPQETTEVITVEKLKEVLDEYTNNKSVINVDLGESEYAKVEIVHSVTLGDIYIMLLLSLLLITTLLTRLIGRR
ncbi:hypothetical protein [Lysinibacillus sp. 54212]|uniref:hypothetical protein n=1 Tax=Lysinibacillus sp. 54212 TaxID=3119829 RepID=UPI002FCBFE1F